MAETLDALFQTIAAPPPVREAPHPVLCTPHPVPLSARHAALLGPVAACSLSATALAVLAMPGHTALQLVYAAMIGLNVGLLALSAWSGILGALVAFFGRSRPIAGAVEASASGCARTALLVPVYNENPDRVFNAVAVMRRSIAPEATGSLDIFVLSDTQDSVIAAAEEAAYAACCATMGAYGPALHYRRRTPNTRRKAGNIAEFCARWGSGYDFMLVLDADSLMTGPAIARLIGAAEANPRAGIIQTMCYPIGRASLFARIQQFGARLYGPLLARGVAFWQGPRGSYWGHNAILRTAAFAAHCQLPDLPGRAPLGGEILCHDTVEAALMLRAG